VATLSTAAPRRTNEGLTCSMVVSTFAWPAWSRVSKAVAPSSESTFCGEGDGGSDSALCEPRVLRQDLVDTLACRQLLEHEINGYPRAGDDRFPHHGSITVYERPLLSAFRGVTSVIAPRRLGSIVPRLILSYPLVPDLATHALRLRQRIQPQLRHGEVLGIARH